MRKPKIILGAIAALAVVGGIFAFNVKQTDFVFTHSATDPVNVCTVPYTGYTTTNAGTLTTFGTTDPLKPCIRLTITAGL